jgi:hypothetical protein
MSSSQARKPDGTPAGGQWAPSAHAEANVELSPKRAIDSESAQRAWLEHLSHLIFDRSPAEAEAQRRGELGPEGTGARGKRAGGRGQRPAASQQQHREGPEAGAHVGRADRS